MTAEFWLWVLIAAGGMLGGLLYGMRDKQLTLPHWEDKRTWNPGFLGDILFGLAGGFVIFIIVPGSFDYTSGGWETIQILALAGVGGYGGRAIVEKLVNEQIQELEKNIHELRQHEKWDAIAIKLVDKHLDDDPDTPQIPKADLQKAISSASSAAKVLIFEKARQFRRECLHDEQKKFLLSQAIPIFECLIEDDKDHKYHRNHGQLGFVLKDMLKPDWKRAEEELSLAIEMRNKANDEGYLAYEFNRALCRMHLGHPIGEVLSDLNAARAADKTMDWVQRPDAQRAPGYVKWLQENTEALKDWIAANQIEVT